MSPRYVCPSMGAVRRPISYDATALRNGSSRGFCASARRLEAQSGNNSTPAPPSAAPVERASRRVRNANAASAVTKLQYRRPLPKDAGLAGGSFISGTPQTEANGGASTNSAPKVIQPRKPLISRVAIGAPAPQGTAAPLGTMIRAPSKLRITRNAPGSKTGGPNLRGRSAGNRGSGGQPKRREQKGKEGRKKGANPNRMQEEPKIEQTLSDTMVQHLLRLQRKEWDRVPYQPKYAHGSLEANELIHIGRELFKGETPPIKIWGPLERQLGVVGMHGAAAHLKVTRVLDGDHEPFGHEEKRETPSLGESRTRKKVRTAEAKSDKDQTPNIAKGTT